MIIRGGPASEHAQPRVYIAGPIFNEQQLAAVDSVVETCHAMGYVTYSPSRDGVMLKPHSPPSKRDEVWWSNVLAIRAVDLMIVILDTKDTGTIWELGMATGRDLPIVALTLQVPMMNVMLERGVIAHVRDLHDLQDVLNKLRGYLSFGTKQTEDVRSGYVRTLNALKAMYSYSGETQ